MPGTFSYTESTNTVVVTAGTSIAPATFADFVAADRSTAATLKAAAVATTGMVLTYPVRPVEQRALYLTLTTAIAGGAAASGDESIDIYGTTCRWTTFSASEAAGQTVLSVTDASIFKVNDVVRLIDISAPATTETATISAISLAVGANTITVGAITNAYVAGDIVGLNQTETIDTSAAHGAFVTTKAFGQIAYFDCNGYDGTNTVAVTQPIWGAVYDFGNGLIQLDAIFVVGNAVTSTWFADSDKKIVIKSGLINAHYTSTIYSRANATLVLSDCQIHNKESTYTTYFRNSGGSIYLYNCTFNSEKDYIIYSVSGPIYNYMTLCLGKATIGTSRTTDIIQRYTCIGDNASGSNGLILYNAPASASDIYVNNVYYVLNINIGTNTTVLENFIAGPDYGSQRIRCYDLRASLFLVNSLFECGYVVDYWHPSLNTGSIYRQFTFNIELQDKDGVAQAGKAVKMLNTDESTVFDTTTDANGNITFSDTLHSNPTANGNQVSYKRYYYSAGAQTKTYAPFYLYVDGTLVATYGTDDVEGFEANGGGRLTGPIGGGGGAYLRRR